MNFTDFTHNQTCELICMNMKSKDMTFNFVVKLSDSFLSFLTKWPMIWNIEVFIYFDANMKVKFFFLVFFLAVLYTVLFAFRRCVENKMCTLDSY